MNIGAEKYCRAMDKQNGRITSMRRLASLFSGFKCSNVYGFTGILLLKTG